MSLFDFNILKNVLIVVINEGLWDQRQHLTPFVYNFVCVFHIRKSYFTYKLWQSIHFWVNCPFNATNLQIWFCGLFLEGCKHGRIHYWLHWGRHIPSNIFWLLLFFSGWLLQLVSPILNFPKPTIENKYFGTVCIKHNCQLSKSPVTGQAIWDRKQFQRRGI